MPDGPFPCSLLLKHNIIMTKKKKLAYPRYIHDLFLSCSPLFSLVSRNTPWKNSLRTKLQFFGQMMPLLSL